MQTVIVAHNQLSQHLCLRLARARWQAVLVNAAPGLASQTGWADYPALPARIAGMRQCLWLITDHEAQTEARLNAALSWLKAGDIVVDGTAGSFSGAMQRAEKSGSHGVDYIDLGICGSALGVQYGFALMAGGSARSMAALCDQFDHLAPFPKAGWLHGGPTGSGHFLRQVLAKFEIALLNMLAQTQQALSSSGPMYPTRESMRKLWREGSELRAQLLALADAYLGRNPPELRCEPFVDAAFKPGPQAVWPALQVARLISLCAQQAFELDDRLLDMLYPAAAD